MTPVIFGLSGLSLDDDERAFFRAADPVGYILFARNCANPAQLRALTDDLRALHGRDDLLITIDQEGGPVARMKPPVWPAYPAGRLFDRLYEVAPISAIEAARANAEAIGLDLAEAGISADALPLLDVAASGEHEVIGDRALGQEPARVAALGRALLDGLARAGIAGTIKHMPGHGRALADSHKRLPVVEASDAALQIDLAPFRALSDAPLGMTAHVLFAAWDADNPATQSHFVVNEIIRNRIGFGGLLMTDDIDMAALAGSVSERGERAIAAGCDVVLNCWARMDDMRALVERLPAMTGEARARLDKAMAGTQAFRPFARADAERRAERIARRDALLAAAGVDA